MPREPGQPRPDLPALAWREACRHPRIADAARRIAELLRARVPLDRLIIRHLDAADSCAQTVAVAPAPSLGLGADVRTPCSPEDLRAVLAWCGRGRRLEKLGARLPGPVRRLVPPDVTTEALIAPLGEEGAWTGIVVVVAPKAGRFREADVRTVLSVLDPISAALEREFSQRRSDAPESLVAGPAANIPGPRADTTHIVGVDVGLRAVMQRVALAAPADVPVLLMGETGTGKEVIARAIHTHSPRSHAPFIRVNCGAIPPELIDSQLFGHERGSFTGAVDTRVGWFERADGGTLFLDEIGDLPLPTQVRLLRVLQDGHLERVGGSHSLHVNVRVVGATHRDLGAMVHEGHFRKDLWYRLAVFPIPIPPLRERPDDIHALACHFAEKAAARFGLPLVMPTPADVRTLIGYPWPGNVRELASVIDRAALLGNGRRLEVGTALGLAPLPSDPRTPAAVAPRAGEPARETAIRSETVPLADAMRRHIEDTLRACHGRVEGPFGAAAALEINPHTLRARMRKLRVDPAHFRPAPRR